ncbi:uncharacterized protein LOC144436829 [Glandiceps talaboti]
MRLIHKCFVVVIIFGAFSLSFFHVMNALRWIQRIHLLAQRQSDKFLENTCNDSGKGINTFEISTNILEQEKGEKTTTSASHGSEKYEINTDIETSSLQPFNTRLLNGCVLAMEVRQAMKGRYIFAVVNFNGGPNFQYRQFKVAVQMAIHMRRTIVLSDFQHHRMKESYRRVHFHETFDEDIFKEFMPTITIDEYVENCGKVIKDVITNPYLRNITIDDNMGTYLIQKEWLWTRAGISIPSGKHLPRSESKCQQRMKEADTSPCIVMTSPVDFQGVQVEEKAEVHEALNKHLVRTHFLRKAVASIIPKLCNGKSILGLHWRNRTGEQ